MKFGFGMGMDLTTRKILRVLGLAALSLALGIAVGQGGETTRRTNRSHLDFGPAPENYSEIFDLPSRNEERRPRPDHEEQTAPKERERGPVRFPVEPQPATLDPALDLKITRRYQDPRVLRVLAEMTSQRGEAFFREISQMIDHRHIEPTTYSRRMEQGALQFQRALSNAAFQQATGIRPTPAAMRTVQLELASLQRDVRVRSQADAVAAIRQLGRRTEQSLGLNPGAVYFEFAYASLETLDPFSMLLPPEKSGQFSLGLDENLVGIGVEIAADPAGLKIIKAFAGGPAAEATLRSGDLITAVNGRQLAGMDMSQAAELISGPAGTPVKLGLRRGNLVAETTLIRRAIEIRSISEVRMLDEATRVGYIKLDQFAESSADELDAALWKLHNAGMESLVLDLRGNPGGYLTTAIEISDRFLPMGTIVSTHGRNFDDDSQASATRTNTWKVPLVVLIDRQSASASEIFAAAIQENSRGMIVGEQSYGKGTVQTLFPLKSATAGLRLTTAKFYSPEGRAMSGVGVIPDVKVRTGSQNDEAAMLQAALVAARDPQLQIMAERLSRPNRTGLRTFQVAHTEN